MDPEEIAWPARGTRTRVHAKVALLFADGGSDRDLVLPEPVRAGFRITSGRADEIIEDLKDELVSIVQ